VWLSRRLGSLEEAVMPNGRTLAWVAGIALVVVIAHDRYKARAAR
jgi:hypothetical protein